MSADTPGPDHRADASAPVLGVVEHTLETVLSGSAVGPYRKLLLQLAAPASALLLAALAGPLSLVQILTAVVGAATAIVLYRLPGAYSVRWKVAKTVAAFVSAGVQALVVLLVGGLAFGDVSPDQWVGVVLQALAAIGIGVIPNDPEPRVAPVVDGVADVSSLPGASR